MGEVRNFITPLHLSTPRDYLARMVDDKVFCMGVAKQYGFDYWDGDRRFGYGGYSYRPGYFAAAAKELISTYGLKAGSKVLDVGCGKGFLLHEMLLQEPGLQIAATDISEYGLERTTDLVRPFTQVLDARELMPFEDKQFDLVISVGMLHNLRLPELFVCLQEIQRVGRKSYIMSESYRNSEELFNLECWALTCESFLDLGEWEWMFETAGFTGDYELIFFS